MKSLLDKHPPWVHWSFFVVWAVFGTVGPIWLLIGLIVQPSVGWWVGLALCAVAAVTLVIDAAVAKRLQFRGDGSWAPWEPPRIGGGSRG